MKYLLPALLTLVFLSTCGDTATTAGSGNAATAETTDAFVAAPGQDTMSYRPLYLHPIPAADQLNANQTAHGGYGQIILPPLEHPTTQLLLKGFWVTEYYIDQKANPYQKVAGAGQWLRFNPDGTYTAGHWDRQTHAGAWYLSFAQEYAWLTLDANVDRRDAVWELQRISSNQRTMGWRRIYDTGFGPYGKSIILKQENLDNMPTKEQYAGQLQSLQ